MLEPELFMLDLQGAKLLTPPPRRAPAVQQRQLLARCSSAWSVPHAYRFQDAGVL